ncbi:MAG: glycerol-3-phosphate transporter, partial [Proteobacteria bacterium]|nr:glycerol-3-phosphate transporter [Pseudomonadota bacterium]
MVEKRPLLDFVTHAVLIVGAFLIAFPLYVTFVASTLSLDEIMTGPMPLLPGSHFIENYSQVLFAGSTTGSKASVLDMLFNSAVMALAVPLGKISVSILSSFAIVYFRFPLRNFFFWTIFVTLMLPVEVRIIPTFKVMADLGLLNT